MAINYPGQQKIGYGKAQVFDTSKLAEGVKYVGQVREKKKEEKKKKKAEFEKNLKDIDVSKIRDVDVPYINSQVNAVSDYFYKNSAAIMNPKLDGGKASMELSRLKTFAVGEVQRSIGIKHEDEIIGERISSDPEHYGGHSNYEYYDNRRRTSIDSPLWDDHKSATTYEKVDLTMTEEEKTEFYSKSKTEQKEILKSRIPSQMKLDDYNALETVEEKQQWLVSNNYELGDSGDNDDGVDGDWGDLSEDAETQFLKDVETDIAEQTTRIDTESTGDITQYENYSEYSDAFGAINPGFNAGLLNEEEFDNLKSEYDEYETKWNDSQGAFEITTHGGETVVGLHNQSLTANPLLGEHIQDVASKIVPKNVVTERDGKWQVGEGNVTQFTTKVEADRASVIDGMWASIRGHRFEPEMMKELNAELLEMQKIHPEFTMDDLLVKKALPFVDYDETSQLVRDIFRHKPANISVKTIPETVNVLNKHTAGSSYQTPFNVQSGRSITNKGDVSYVTLATGINTQITESTTGGKAGYPVTADDQIGFIITGASNTLQSSLNKKSQKFDMFVPEFIAPFNTADRDMEIDVVNAAGTTITVDLKKGERIPAGAQTYIDGDWYDLDPVFDNATNTYTYLEVDGDTYSKHEWFLHGTGQYKTAGKAAASKHEVILPFKGSHVDSYMAFLKMRTKDDGGKSLNYLRSIIGNRIR